LRAIGCCPKLRQDELPMSRPTKRDQLLQLLSSFKSVAPGWRTAKIGFERRQVLAVDRMRWVVNYKIHALRDFPRGPYRPWFRSSITLWPSGQAARDRQGWRPRLREQQWYRRCHRELARHGYHGDWSNSPWGRFGDYWKRLADSDALTAEVWRLDRMQLQTTGLAVSFGDVPSSSSARKPGRKRRAEGDAFFELVSSFGRLESEWWTSSFVLHKRELVNVDRAPWTVHYTLGVDRARKLWLRSSIDLWPSRRSVRDREGWHPRLLRQRWYQGTTDQLARLGYKGEWRLGFGVRSGEFEKRPGDAKAAAAELARLDRLQLTWIPRGTNGDR
jgi:hypothetical protein